MNGIDILDFHKVGKNGKVYDIIDKKMADYITSQNNIMIVEGKPYIYKDGVYAEDDDGLLLKTFIKTMMVEEIVTITKINRVYNLIMSDYRLVRSIDEVNNYPSHWINFKNGFLDVKTMQMNAHSPFYLAINQIPHNFDINRTVPADSVVNEFLQGVIKDPDDLQMLLAYIGYCMTKDTQQQKFLVISGTGGTGKSTIIRLIEKAVGTANISNISLQDLNERFRPTCLFGKLLNSCADISSKAMEQVDVIKKITGEDIIMGEYKGGAVFFFRSYAKLLFSANEIPVSLDDKTDAFFRRLLILRIDKRCHTIANLEERLTAAVDDFIFMAVQALRAMYERGGILESVNSKKSALELQKNSDSVAAFIDDMLVPRADSAIKKGSLLDEYVKYCTYNGRKALGRNSFYNALENKGFSDGKTSGIGVFRGWAYKEEDFQPLQGYNPYTD